nr:ArdC-like ssDNA-binding domain-containing protein [Niveispirillum sp. SYP-B3756]
MATGQRNVLNGRCTLKSSPTIIRPFATGSAFPCGRAVISADPFCGDTPQRPHRVRVRIGSDRTSLYDDITSKIISELEAGRVPWVQPWGTAAAKAPLAMPRNAVTGRQYSSIALISSITPRHSCDPSEV